MKAERIILKRNKWKEIRKKTRKKELKGLKNEAKI